MGQKYASVHLYAQNNEQLIDSIINYYGKSLDNQRMMNVFDQVFKMDSDKKDLMIGMLDLLSCDKLIIKFEHFISIYDESQSFESIEEFCQTFSQEIDGTILFTSNFDEDIFKFGIAENGTILTKRLTGAGLAAYGLEEELLDTKITESVLGQNLTRLCEQINSIKDIEALENELEEAFDIILNHKLSWISSQNEFQKILEKGNAHFYQKV